MGRGRGGGGQRAPLSCGADFDPAWGRAAAEVFRLDLGALAPDVVAEGEFVTEDLIG